MMQFPDAMALSRAEQAIDGASREVHSLAFSASSAVNLGLP
jgi:hypothetical protein